jgi:hypothetical protein
MATKTGIAPKTVRIPITNVYAGGDYTAQLSVGSQNASVNVLLDTGSSTFALKQANYKAATDKNLKPTSLVQDITYGTGGWAGPVVTTTVTMGVAGNVVTLNNASIAVADEQQQQNFGNADGILGLAYGKLNNAADLTAYLQKKGINPPVTYPWPFPINNSAKAVAQFQQFLSQSPQKDVPPYFTELQQGGLTPNKFAFYTLRSFPNVAGANIAQDPLNQGFFILGGGEEQTDLYQGAFVNVKVLKDDYYNTNLTGIQVGSGPVVKVAALPAADLKTNFSNSIIDSGTNSLWLAAGVYDSILKSLVSLNAQFGQIISQSLKNQGIVPTSELNLSEWPSISFILMGDTGQNVTLTCSPQTYWQLNFPKAGQAIFQLSDNNGPQSVLGLPLLNNYFSVFDRSLDKNGVIRFAPIKQP